MDVIRVIYHYEDGGWWAESPDVERWSAGAETFDEVRRLAEEGVRFTLDRDDVRLEHYVPERSEPTHT
jgi:predicted RNase H-like HicB family nuclease